MCSEEWLMELEKRRLTGLEFSLLKGHHGPEEADVFCVVPAIEGNQETRPLIVFSLNY